MEPKGYPNQDRSSTTKERRCKSEVKNDGQDGSRKLNCPFHLGPPDHSSSWYPPLYRGNKFKDESTRSSVTVQKIFKIFIYLFYLKMNQIDRTGYTKVYYLKNLKTNWIKDKIL